MSRAGAAGLAEQTTFSGRVLVRAMLLLNLRLPGEVAAQSLPLRMMGRTDRTQVVQVVEVATVLGANEVVNVQRSRRAGTAEQAADYAATSVTLDSERTRITPQAGVVQSGSHTASMQA